MAKEQINGLGAIAASIRGLFGRLTPLEAKSGQHDSEIESLKRRTEVAEAELDRLNKIAQQQGTELAQNQAALADLNRAVNDLEEEVESKSTDIGELKSTLHGERVKRGRANAKLERLEAGNRRRGR